MRGRVNQWDMMNDEGVSVVLGTYNRLKFLRLTVQSIREELREASFSHEIIVIDGGSTDGTLEWLPKQRDILTIIQHNHGTWQGRPIPRRSWGYFMNLGFKTAKGKYVCMLSDDCLVVPGSIIRGYDLFQAKLKAGDKIGYMPFYWREWPMQEKYGVVLTVGNRYLLNHGLFLKEALEEVNYIDEENYMFYQADSDLCLRILQKGYGTTVSEESYIEHYSHANTRVRKSNLDTKKQDYETYIERWKDMYRSNPEQVFFWKEKEHSDSSKTAAKFERIYLWHRLKTFMFENNLAAKIVRHSAKLLKNSLPS